VGLVFIVLFGVILSQRAGLSMSDHAVLPTGESTRYRTTAEAFSRNVNPFMTETAPLVVQGTEVSAPVAPEPGEESLPAPATLAVSEETPTPDDMGTVAFGPSVVETPMTASQADAPTAESPPVETAAAARPVYTVRPGDTMIAIARRHYGQEGERLWKGIYEANRQVLRNPDHLVAGQKLVIPQLPSAAAPPASATPPSRGVTADDLARMFGTQSDLVEWPARSPSTYKVQPGDTFYGIAKKLYGDDRYGRLLQLKNRHLVPEASKLRVGRQIVLLDGVNNDTTVALR